MIKYLKDLNQGHKLLNEIYSSLLLWQVFHHGLEGQGRLAIWGPLGLCSELCACEKAQTAWSPAPLVHPLWLHPHPRGLLRLPVDISSNCPHSVAYIHLGSVVMKTSVRAWEVGFSRKFQGPRYLKTILKVLEVGTGFELAHSLPPTEAFHDGEGHFQKRTKERPSESRSPGQERSSLSQRTTLTWVMPQRQNSTGDGSSRPGGKKDKWEKLKNDKDSKIQLVARKLLI